MKKVLASILVFSFLFFLGVTLVSAADPACDSAIEVCDENTVNVGIKLDNPFKGGDTLTELLQKIIQDILMPIGGVLAVLAFIYSGFLYVTAQGNETKLKTANTALLYTAIGTAVLLGSWVLAKVIENTVNQLKI